MVSLIQSFKPEKTAGVNFNPDGTLLATSTRDHSVTIWNVRSGQTTQPLLYGHIGSVSSVAFQGDGKLLASGSADSDIRLWDVETHELLGTLSAQQKESTVSHLAPRQEI